MRWPSGCLETNIVPLLGDDQIEAFRAFSDQSASYPQELK
jgi:hypothetical protein